MAELTPSQVRMRERIESMIRLMAPALTLVLAAGDRLSRLVQPEDYEYYPARALAERDPAAGGTGADSLDQRSETR